MRPVESALNSVMTTLDAAKAQGIEIDVALIESTLNYVLGNPVYASVDRAELEKLVEDSINVWMDEARTLDDDTGHKPWYPEHKPEWRFWKRYRRYLIEKQHRAPDVVARLDDVTDQILMRLEDPTDSTRVFDRRGLVVGLVQSGKTANYTGLICKAVDAGYKLVIVLAGVHNSLRAQTQSRLDEEFLGFDTAVTQITNQVNRIGVAALPGEQFIQVASLTNRLEAGDFRTAVAQTVNVHPGVLPLVLIVKKNVTVLNNIIRYFEKSPVAKKDPDTGATFIDDVPLLLIDDEADHASVNTREIPVDEDGLPLADYDPTRINEQIRRLLNVFRQKVYVGYTATPFANIFIHESAPHTTLGDDLFPRSFIMSLPAPSNYFGPVEVFGLADAEVPGLPIVREVLDSEEFLPANHKKTAQLPAELPASMQEAIRCFILSCAVRRVRGQGTAHNSMLIHVTRFVDVQTAVYARVETVVSRLKQRLRYGDGGSTKNVRNEFRELWDRDYRTTSIKMGRAESSLESWAQIEAELLPATEKIVLKKINGTAADILDYREHADVGVNVIAIGGDKLSRGLTLEGLTISYYLRASRMYDTLMQMGRWFGYRVGYEDLCRLYTTPELIEWYQHIAAASEELRDLFDVMAARGETPETFGLRVRTHSVLMVTSRVKMRNATTLKLSYSGDISETVVFDPSAEPIAANLRLTNEFLSSLGTPDSAKDRFIWRDVGGEAVHDFIDRFRTHKDADRARSELLTDYIGKQLKHGELTAWTVVLVSKTGSDSGPAKAYRTTIAGQPVTCTQRKRTHFEPARRLSIRRLLSPTDERLDLSSAELEKAVQACGKTPPTGPAIRSQRPRQRGLLLIYPLDPTYFTRDTEDPSVMPDVIVGFGISFPESETAERVDYKVNNVYWHQEYGD